MKKRMLGLLLLLASFASAGKLAAEFRLRKDPDGVMRGWILEYDEEGFQFERFGRGARRRIEWDDLVAEDARRLRVGFKLELTEEERKGLIDGQEIFFKGGGSVRGILIGIDEDGTHRVRVEGLVLPYPGERVERVDEVKIREEEAYSPTKSTSATSSGGRRATPGSTAVSPTTSTTSATGRGRGTST